VCEESSTLKTQGVEKPLYPYLTDYVYMNVNFIRFRLIAYSVTDHAECMVLS